MNNLNIREIVDKSVDFFKQHYEYLLPFSLLYFLLNLPQQFIKNAWMLPIMLIVMPLSFSITYFVDRVLKGREKKFNLFFEIYNYFFKYLGISILRGLIFLLLLSPLLYSSIDVIKEYDFDMNRLNEAIQDQSIHLNKTVMISMFASFVLVILSLPFLMFNEYYGILDDLSIGESFKRAYEVGAKNYLSLFKILIVSFIVLFAGLCACCIGLVIALPMIYLIYYFAYRTLEPR